MKNYFSLGLGLNKLSLLTICLVLFLSACTPSKTTSYPQTISQKGIEMVLVPAGEFKMGSDVEKAMDECQKNHSTCQGLYFDDQAPSHKVYLDAFYVDVYEVTNAAYAKCVDDGICNPPKENSSYTRDHYFDNPTYADYPVVHVSWDDANTYCAWRGARLPTEAEWEKAARGEKSFVYPWGNKFIGTNANLCDVSCIFPRANKNLDDGYEDTAPVGSYSEGGSPYGVYNMAGNVAEWVADWYAVDYYANSPRNNPSGPSEGSVRVARGGSCISSDSWARSATRIAAEPSANSIDLGFRCASSP